MPGTRLRDELTEHLRRVQALTDAGIPPPRAWTELADRFSRYRSLPLTAAERLPQAIIRPVKTDDIRLAARARPSRSRQRHHATHPGPR
ncbi:MAG TPA: hypothetical protein VEF72_28035 [Mycobacterium sp.]|nr:hypothetical protein [Mycobacterium sp.]